LFFSLYAGEPELECPGCEANLCGAFRQDALYLQSFDSRMRPVSPEARVTAREPSAAVWDDASPPPDDFDWLVALCRRAGQERALFQISCLYGTARCPLCGEEFVVMPEMARSQGP
jgi:hypothetical protein